jgi:ketosteroid isomerase-like protein
MSASSSNRPGPREIFQRLLETTRAGAWDEMVDLYHPDCLIEMPFAPPGVPKSSRRREELRSRIRSHGVATDRRIDGAEVTAVHETPDPEVVVAEWILTGEVASTGRPFRVAYLMLIRVRDGLILASRDYSDLLAGAIAFDRLSALAAAYEAPLAEFDRDPGLDPPAHAGFDPRPLFERLAAASSRADWNAFAALFAEDGVMEYPFPMPGMPARLEGREAIRAQYASLNVEGGATVSGLSDPLVHATLDPDVFLVEYFLVGAAGSGRRYRVPFAAVIRTRDGLFRSFRDYTDVLAASAVRGVLADLVAGAGATGG